MNVLFICRANIGRSQMAEAFFNALSKKHSATSAGIAASAGRLMDVSKTRKSSRSVPPLMMEEGIDVSEALVKPVTPQMVKKAGKVIVILETHERTGIPDYILKSGKATYWPVPDGRGKPHDFHVKMREDIRKRVERLVHEIG